VAWPVYTLTDWGREEIEHFARRWTLAFEIATHGDTPESRAAAEAERQDLLAAILPGSGVERLASNPLLLTIMALIKRQRVTLPRERVKLYELYLETLISAWNKARALDRRPVGPEVNYLETVQVLAPLALWLREENPQAGLVGRAQIESWLTDYYKREWGEHRGPARQRARAFLASVRHYSNLLVERGEQQYGFLHLTFEEMLAAKGIAQVEDQEGLAAAMAVVKQSPFKAGRVLRELCEGDLDGEDRGRNVLLAGQALADVGEAGADRASAVAVTSRLVEVMQDPAAPPPARRDAGHLLGELDWEPEGGLDLWVEVPAGPFHYGDGKERRAIEAPYFIGAYPVTNKQFARFVDAGGYERREYWSDDGWAWRTGTYDSKAPDDLRDWLSRRPPEERDRPFYWGHEWLASPLCPVVGVTWFEAQAYCRWLGEWLQDTGFKLQVRRDGALETVSLEPGTCAARLPAEEEWERAVRGTDGREYPWGQDWHRARLNCAEWWTGREFSEDEEWLKWVGSDELEETDLTPTAVVTFPDGVNAARIWDGAGNVWEWTGSWYQEGETCVLRGGSWYDSRGSLAARLASITSRSTSTSMWGCGWSSLALGLLNPDF